MTPYQDSNTTTATTDNTIVQVNGGTDNTPIGNTGDSLHVVITNIEIDPENGAGGLVTISDFNYYVHAGQAFEWNANWTMSSGQVHRILFTTPSSPPDINLVYNAYASGATTVEFYSGTTYTGGTGTAGTAWNRNRQSSNTADTSVLVDPTVISDGTLLRSDEITSAANIKSGATSGDFDTSTWVLDESTVYMLKITSGANGNVVVPTALWYEAEST